MSLREKYTVAVQFQIWLCVLCVCAGSWAQRAGSPDYRPLEPPLRAPPPPPGADARAARNVVSSWLRMPLDHFDPHNNNTFWMQYMSNEELFGGVGSPIFIMVGGEWDIHPAWLTTGNMYEMARENRGHLFYTEHRYYGATLPFTVFTKETLQYLNVDQALADLAYFIREMKQQPRFAHSDVILYGGSYAANMALWFKQRYPHLVKGVVASSGPIKAQADFTGYLRVVNEALLSEGGQECLDIIRLGVQETVAALQTEAGRREMEATYNLCVPLDYDNPFDLGYFSALITWTFSGAVQTARPGTLRLLCDNFRTDLYGVTPMQKLSGYINQNRVTCTDMRYEGYINWFKAVNDNTKAWYYQTCTEYGYYQTVGAGTVFDDLTWMNLEFYIDFCKQVYDPSFDEAFVKDAVERVNLVFGALEPEVNNTINIHGVIDPWRALGVYDSHLGETSPTITVPRASHCFDMQNWLTTDTILMTQAQQTARRLVRQWLAQ